MGWTALARGFMVATFVTIVAVVAGGDSTSGDDRHRVAGEIPFGYSFEEAAARAAEDGRPIFAYFTFAT